MRKYKNEILTKLIDKYEKSKSFIGINTVNQSFAIHIEKEFPEYGDDARVAEIQAINRALEDLEALRFVKGKKKRNGILNSVQLNVESLEECYKYLRREPKKAVNDKLRILLGDYCEGDGVAAVFSREQINRIASNKKVEHFNNSLSDYKDLLDVLSAITKVEQETYIRDFSIQVLGDSKKFEKMKSTVISVLYDYGDYPEKETILEDLNIVKNPGHVYFKGNGVIVLSGQLIDLSNLQGDIAVSSLMIKDLDQVIVSGKRVVTIENLTSFNTYKPNDEFVIYLGGYHNSLRRDFIKKVYEQNSDVKYYHFGDIDVGGFQILLHLREKTGVPFLPMNMDIETLSNNCQYAKQLTENDRRRLIPLLETEFREVVAYMLENNCKLEQEALDIRQEL